MEFQVKVALHICQPIFTNEFISILGKQVFKIKNLSELKTAKYFSVSVDSTPDYSHIDQMIFIIRIFKDDNPVKSFLEFIYITQH